MFMVILLYKNYLINDLTLMCYLFIHLFVYFFVDLFIYLFGRKKLSILAYPVFLIYAPVFMNMYIAILNFCHDCR